MKDDEDNDPVREQESCEGQAQLNRPTITYIMHFFCQVDNLKWKALYFISPVHGTAETDHPSSSAATMHSSHQVHRSPLKAWHHHFTHHIIHPFISSSTGGT